MFNKHYTYHFNTIIIEKYLALDFKVPRLPMSLDIFLLILCAQSHGVLII